MSMIRDLLHHRELLVILVERNLKIRYKNTSLGFLWTLLGPVFQILIYTVFLRILKIPVDLESLVVGIFMWQFLAITTGDSLNVILGNSTLITKTPFPRIVLPLSTVLANFINFALSILVLIVFLLFVRPDVHVYAVCLLPVFLASHVALCLGLSLLVSGCNVFFRDTEHLVSVGLMAWFFLSPAMYDIETFVSPKFGEGLVSLYLCNPMAALLAGYRLVFLGMNESLAAVRYLPGLALCWGVLAIGIVSFRRMDGRFGDVL